PFLPPRREGNVIHGRGSCDDKGSVVAILMALKMLDEALRHTGRRLRRNLVAMVVIEEETGGNGSLSLALDRQLRERYGSLLVLECTDNDIHPANRGAVWYRAELACPGVSLLEMAAFVIEQLEQEGNAIRAESRHELFPQRPVQTCHGILGHFGEHPSRICGEISFDVVLDGRADGAVELCLRDCIDAALAEYTAAYGDKTAVRDPATGSAKVDHHYDLVRTAQGFRCDVHGSTGHMGSIRDNDGAITKMAAFVRALVRSRTRIEALGGGAMALHLAGQRCSGSLVLEGGQGFVPTHGIEEIMERVRQAARAGAAAYLRRAGRADDPDTVVRVTYDKLHNAAFDGDPDSPAMRDAVAAAKAVGIWRDRPITGWTVSCDARLFANEYPGMPVLTCGAGQLAHAHADSEHIDLDELLDSAAFLGVYLLRRAGIE
ncbi:MAG: M20/M25/M40 family metallo-hydrolase, partial [Lentisphaeria bacterium]|nr:M20/M25/M40 family metallo-hydrolase [Lentisphaeria bacterium]